MTPRRETVNQPRCNNTLSQDLSKTLSTKSNPLPATFNEISTPSRPNLPSHSTSSSTSSKRSRTAFDDVFDVERQTPRRGLSPITPQDDYDVPGVSRLDGQHGSSPDFSKAQGQFLRLGERLGSLSLEDTPSRKSTKSRANISQRPMAQTALGSAGTNAFQIPREAGSRSVREQDTMISSFCGEEDIIMEDIADPYATCVIEVPGKYRSQADSSPLYDDHEDQSSGKSTGPRVKASKNTSRSTLSRHKPDEYPCEDRGEPEHTGSSQPQANTSLALEPEPGEPARPMRNTPTADIEVVGGTLPKPKRPRGRPRKTRPSLETQETATPEFEDNQRILEVPKIELASSTASVEVPADDDSNETARVVEPNPVNTAADSCRQPQTEKNETNFSTPGYNEDEGSTTPEKGDCSSEQNIMTEEELKFFKYDMSPPRKASTGNTRISDYLNSKQEKPRENLRFGWVYIFEFSNHVKIGKTRNEPSRRLKQWQKCTQPLFEVEDTYQNAFDQHGIVEQLILTEFHDKRKKYKCSAPCGAVHTEYLEIDKWTASKSRDRWRKWIMQQKPFDCDWKLTRFWQDRVNKLPKHAATVNWDEWTQPGRFEKLQFRFQNFKTEQRDTYFRRLSIFNILLLLPVYWTMRLYGSILLTWALILWGLISI